MKIKDIKIQVIRRDAPASEEVGPNPLMNAANLHVTCSIKNCEFFEWWVPEKLMWDFGVKESLKVDNEGYVHVPKGPGLGMEVDWEYVNAHIIATL